MLATPIRSYRLACASVAAVVALAGAGSVHAGIVLDDNFNGSVALPLSTGGWTNVGPNSNNTNLTYSGAGEAYIQTGGFGAGPLVEAQSTTAFNPQVGTTTITTLVNPRNIITGTGNFYTGIAASGMSSFLAIDLTYNGNLSLVTSSGSSTPPITIPGSYNQGPITLIMTLTQTTVRVQATHANGSFDSGTVNLSALVPAFSFASLGTNASAVIGADGFSRFVDRITIDNSAVPAPASAALLGFGGLIAARRRRTV